MLWSRCHSSCLGRRLFEVSPGFAVVVIDVALGDNVLVQCFRILA